MSLPNWFYPIVMVWLVAVPGFAPHTPESSSRRSAWLMLIDTLFLLPWMLALFLDEPLAAWVGVEILVLILLFDLLWKKPSEALREAWIKVSMSWFLSWLLIGTAVALSGVHPIVENLFYPLPSVELDRIRPVLAGSLFLIGLCLKLGLPPFQQGIIDLMDVIRPEDHRRWSLQMRWALVFAAWQIMPVILGALSSFNQQVFVAVLILGCLAATLVSGVQASVQRSLSYMGGILLLPPLLYFLFMDAGSGLDSRQTLIVWGVTILGFLSFGWLYQDWPCRELPEQHGLLWSDPDSPCALPGWMMRLRIWMGWCVLTMLGLATVAALQGKWLISLLLLLIALASASAVLQQLGIASWRERNQGS
jgi:NADH:ubiquinone oxidoreductase subunit 2 (subunit N)